uniref:Uncharacterized protein n=1 Tax=Oryza punctata TaxID=4537 RepID=A0A0E0LM95_ORYPU
MTTTPCPVSLCRTTILLRNISSSPSLTLPRSAPPPSLTTPPSRRSRRFLSLAFLTSPPALPSLQSLPGLGAVAALKLEGILMERQVIWCRMLETLGLSPCLRMCPTRRAHHQSTPTDEA